MFVRASTLVHSERGERQEAATPNAACDEERHADATGESHFRPVPIARTAIGACHTCGGLLLRGRSSGLEPVSDRLPIRHLAWTVAFDRSFLSSLQRRVRVGISPTSLHGARHTGQAPRANCHPRATVMVTRAIGRGKLRCFLAEIRLNREGSQVNILRKSRSQNATLHQPSPTKVGNRLAHRWPSTLALSWPTRR